MVSMLPERGVDRRKRTGSEASVHFLLRQKCAASSRGRICDEPHPYAQVDGESIIPAMRSPGTWRTD